MFDTHHKDPPTRTPFYELLLGALDDIMLKILMICAIVSMTVDYIMHKEGGNPWYVEGLAIWFAVAVVSLVTAISDYQKEGEFLKKQLIEENSKVVSIEFQFHFFSFHPPIFIILLYFGTYGMFVMYMRYVADLISCFKSLNLSKITYIFKAL